MNKQLTTAIIIGSLIIGGGLIISQSMKQNSIERQQRAELEHERLQKAVDQAGEKSKQVLIDECILEAEREYWDYMRLNKISEKEDGTINALNSVWDRAEKDKQTEIDNCLSRY